LIHAAVLGNGKIVSVYAQDIYRGFRIFDPIKSKDFTYALPTIKNGYTNCKLQPLADNRCALSTENEIYLLDCDKPRSGPPRMSMLYSKDTKKLPFIFQLSSGPLLLLKLNIHRYSLDGEPSIRSIGKMYNHESALLQQLKIPNCCYDRGKCENHIESVRELEDGSILIHVFTQGSISYIFNLTLPGYYVTTTGIPTLRILALRCLNKAALLPNITANYYTKLAKLPRCKVQKLLQRINPPKCLDDNKDYQSRYQLIYRLNKIAALHQDTGIKPRCDLNAKESEVYNTFSKETQFAIQEEMKVCSELYPSISAASAQQRNNQLIEQAYLRLQQTIPLIEDILQKEANEQSNGSTKKYRLFELSQFLKTIDTSSRFFNAAFEKYDMDGKYQTVITMAREKAIDLAAVIEKEDQEVLSVVHKEILGLDDVKQLVMFVSKKYSLVSGRWGDDPLLEHRDLFSLFCETIEQKVMPVVECVQLFGELSVYNRGLHNLRVLGDQMRDLEHYVANSKGFERAYDILSWMYEVKPCIIEKIPDDCKHCLNTLIKQALTKLEEHYSDNDYKKKRLKVLTDYFCPENVPLLESEQDKNQQREISTTQSREEGSTHTNTQAQTGQSHSRPTLLAESESLSGFAQDKAQQAISERPTHTNIQTQAEQSHSTPTLLRTLLHMHNWVPEFFSKKFSLGTANINDRFLRLINSIWSGFTAFVSSICTPFR
jgi:hypothetical protein